MSLQFHPDKNPDDPNSKEKFQQLNEAYRILIDEDSRRLYDQTGDLEATDLSDVKRFVDAYKYYRKLYKRVEIRDIEDFAKQYRGGPEEEEDLENYIEE